MKTAYYKLTFWLTVISIILLVPSVLTGLTDYDIIKIVFAMVFFNTFNALCSVFIDISFDIMSSFSSTSIINKK